MAYSEYDEPSARVEALRSYGKTSNLKGLAIWLTLFSLWQNAGAIGWAVSVGSRIAAKWAGKKQFKREILMLNTFFEVRFLGEV